MKIDFNEIDERTIPEFLGGKGELKARIVLDPEGRGKVLIGTLEPGSTIGLHTHSTSLEVIYILSGTGTCLYNDEEPETLPAGTCHICPKGQTHSLRNDSDELLKFFAVVPEL